VAPTIDRAALIAAALIGAVGCGQLIPWTIGVSTSPLDAGLNLGTAMAAFLSSLALGRALSPEQPSRSRPRALFGVVVVYLVLAGTLTVATSASTRLPSLMEINDPLPRAGAAFAAFVTVLVAVQWAVLRAARDLAIATAQVRVRLPAPTLPEPAPSVPGPGGVTAATSAEL
jgi:hypothetical protein